MLERTQLRQNLSSAQHMLDKLSLAFDPTSNRGVSREQVDCLQSSDLLCRSVETLSTRMLGSMAELQRIIRIIWYSNSWDQIVLFIFGIRSICNFRIVFEYPNSCYRIPNSYRLFIKQNVYQKYRKKASYSCKKKD